MPRSFTTFILSGKNFLIPGDFLKAKPLPNDPPDSIVFEKDTEVATNIQMFFFIEKAKAMPFDDRAGLIDCLHHCLGENQGLFSINIGKTDAGVSFVYMIIKNLKQPSGVQYILTLQMDFNSTVLNLQGYFDEGGITGTRDTAVFEYAMCEGRISGQDKSKWTAAPYSPDFRFGALMNLSEQEEFDGSFPSHPLSELRRFVKMFIAEN